MFTAARLAHKQHVCVCVCESIKDATVTFVGSPSVLFFNNIVKGRF